MRSGIAVRVMAALVPVLVGSETAAVTLVVPTEYTTIHAAMAAAASGDTVLVKPGTYGDFEVRPVFGDVAALGFLVDGVTLTSEAGAESTILDLSQGGGLAPALTGLWIGGVGASETQVRGFTITGAPVSGGSGMVLSGSQNVVISHCVLELEDPGPATDVFRNGINSVLSSATLKDCRLTSCRGPGAAGLGQLGGTITVERTVFEDCQNEAIRISEAQMTIVRECVFDGNVSLIGCAAIVGMSPGIVENCVFVGNEGHGSGAAIVGTDMEIRDCLFDSNHTMGTGAAIFAGSGFGSTIENNTIVRSLQTVSTNAGSAIVILTSSGNVLRNNIIAFSSGSPAIRVGANAELTSECNVFWENADGIGQNYVPGPTDREVDPLFCDPDAADWTLREGSPCLPKDPSGCGLIGAFPQGCGVISVEGASWGEIKNRYRDGHEER